MFSRVFLFSRCLHPSSYRKTQKSTMMTSAASPAGAQPSSSSSISFTSSPWNHGKPLQSKYPALDRDIQAEVCVVGAGIAGVTCAYQLAKAGKSVVLLERSTRASGQSGNTTAHIMNWLDDYYYNAISMHGIDKTKLVAESLLQATDFIEQTSQTEGIECDFTRLDGVLYPVASTSSIPTIFHSSKSILEKELKAAHDCGLNDVKMVDLGGGPEVGGICEALLFPRNADFNPLKYIDGLTDAITRHGGRIYEHTKAWSTDVDTNGYVETDTKKKVHCKSVVLATNSPINHNIAIHARQLPYRTYVVGMLAEKSNFARMDYWSTEEPYHYVRAVEWDDEHYLVIVGGEDHKTGFAPQHSDPYTKLEHHARERWTKLGKVVHKWTGQVYEPADFLYLHGKDPLKPGSNNSYIITGDSGQGMTGGTIGGLIVSDLIQGKHNPWSAVYSPSRVPPIKSLPDIAEESAVTAASFAERVLPKVTLSYDLPPGHGAVVQKGVHKVALYVDKDGKQHAFSAVCPHMGCLVRWNHLGNCFDCPCHGSQFSCYGELMNGPAKADLAKFDW